MVERVYKSHDCCKDVRYPKRNIRISPRWTTALKGEEVWLFAKGVHGDCDGSCFTWKLVSGGGRLPHTEGLETAYYPPGINIDCAASAHIELWCGGEAVADAYITTNIFKGKQRAYEVYVKDPVVKIAPPSPGWPPPGLPPTPPFSKPPPHVTFQDGMRFPKDWKRGDPMPPGASIDLKKLIPADWRPDKLQPRGVIIPPLTEFPRDWRPGDELPAGCRPNTFEIFTASFMIHTPSDHIHVWFPRNYHYCNDVMYGSDRGHATTFFQNYSHAKKRWEIWGPSGPLRGPWSAWYKIPWDTIRKDYPKFVDWRTADMKKKGCCPGGLIRGQVEQQER